MSASGLDLSGEWDGVYSYPDALPPVSFSAALSEAEGILAGRIEDEGGPAAALEGRRAGLDVKWLKTYAHRDVAHDVAYEGRVSADGAEISGRWTIVGSWSGPFLMLRRPKAAQARTRQTRAGQQD